MAEVVVNVLVEQLISAAAGWMQEEISLIKGVKTKLDNMKNKMLVIQTVLESAETQSVKNKFVKIWLEDLQDASYDMVDVLDEWNTKVQRVQQNSSKEILGSSSSSPTTSKSACFSFKQLNCFSSIKQVPLRHDIASRINDIDARVNLLFTQMNTWDLVSKSVENVGLGAITTNRNHIDRTTTSFVDESIVFGRDADRDFLLGKVLSSVDAGHNSMQLISIVGAGGLGKTTLAQLVYNHEKVEKRFGKKRIWVCVSDPFDEVKVAQGILEGLKVDHTKMKSLQTLHQSIEESLIKDKFLLVLDDVWDEDFGKWERLSICLKRGNPESIVLVTTRNEIVARTMGTTPSNILKPQRISDSDCWLLMSQIAFQGRTDKNNNEFEDIGKQIAKKCQGLPLAAKTLGGLLMSKDLAEEWKEVLNSEMWELDKVEVELFPHIFLSYKELSPLLKRCFLILALFPKDSILYVEEVIRIWMGNGFLNPWSEEDMATTGQKYLNFLVSRAFLVEREMEGFTMISMHDIMHDFAIHISGGELFSIMVHDTTENNCRRTKSTSKELSYPKSTRVRHLKIVGNINPTSICFDVGKLRTCDISYVPPNVASDFAERLKRVRLMYLHNCELKQVPESIGNLIHLRVLLLSDNPLVELPETIGNLYNLQQLCLEGLTSLSSLPNSLGKLSNLISIIPGEMALEKAPESVEKLINLQSLGTIRVEAGKRNLGLLVDLNQLRLLEIEFISDYGDDVDANKAAIGRKRHVKEYSLTFNEHKVTDNVVEALKPHPNVQTLKIYHQFPNWIISLDNLAKLEIHNGEKVSTLPPLWQLQSLKELLISEIYASEIIGREFLGMNNNDPNKKFPAFPNLVKLKFTDCTELTGWEDLTPEEDSNHAITVMPNLEILEFDRCNMFSEVPHRLLRQASSLKKLRIYKRPSYRRTGQISLFDFDVTKIAEGVLGGLDLRNKYGGLELNVKYSTKVPTPISYHSYNTLLDIYCAGEPITFLPPMGKIPYLESLTITRFSCLKFIGRDFLGMDDDEEFVAFPNLVKLEISSCNSLEGWEDLKPDDEGKISVMPKLEDLQIQRCQNLTVLPCRLLVKLVPSLKVMKLPDCESSVIVQGEEVKNGVVDTLPHPSPLEILGIERYKGIKLPNWIIYLNNLTELVVYCADNVLSLPALGNLPSLKNLFISHLSVLESIGREFLGIDNATNRDIVGFPKLNELRIYDCTELKVWEDIKPEEEDQIIVIPNLRILQIYNCPKLEELPGRLLCKAASLEKFRCNPIHVYIGGHQCSLHPWTKN